MLNLTAGVVKELRYRSGDLNSPKIEEPLKNKLRQQVVLGSSIEMAQSEIYRAPVRDLLGSTTETAQSEIYRATSSSRSQTKILVKKKELPQTKEVLNTGEET